MRRYGMDHDRYDWSMLPQRTPVQWPGGARVALWIIPALQWFPLDMKGQPFKPPGAMQTAYPDLRHYTLRDYGNRVGIYRVMQTLEALGMKASVAVNAAVAARTPSLVKECVSLGWEVMAHGRDMDHLHHGGLAEEDERLLIQDSIKRLEDCTGQPIHGWLSPAKSESFATPDLVAEAGLRYLCDWVNDDMPYVMKTRAGALASMPHPIDIDDYTILVQNHHTEDDFRDALIDQFDLLYKEASAQAGRIMAISLHPWVIGQPYRISALEQALAHIHRHSGVWSATGVEILDAWSGRA
jgi:peptidoglycan/xylan/chitin deacetylase (PgdA/CDA1 family)